MNTGEYDRKQGTGQTAPSLRDTYRRSHSMIYNLRLQWDRTFTDRVTVGAMVGMEQQKGRNFMSSLLPDINFGSSTTADWGTGGSSGILARDNYFGRFNYTSWGVAGRRPVPCPASTRPEVTASGRIMR